ncbi:MAG: hypothetical protein ABJI60_06340 [Kangiellaceae bacterium]
MSLFSKIFRADENPSKQQCLSLEEGIIQFVGGAKYPPIELDQVVSIEYQPRQEQWQEVQIELKSKGKLNYHFDCDAETLEKAVELVKQGLKPAQPICQFILSAKQGSLSGKD